MPQPSRQPRDTPPPTPGSFPPPPSPPAPPHPPLPPTSRGRSQAGPSRTPHQGARSTRARHRAATPEPLWTRRNILTALAGLITGTATGVAIYEVLHPDRPRVRVVKRAAAPTTSPTPTPQPSPTTLLGIPEVDLSGWSVEEKVGQLLMVGMHATANPASTIALMQAHHIGGLFLGGRSTAGVAATRAAVEAVTSALSPAHGTRVLVSTDQEGGNVQVLRGQGFSEIPEALTQGGWSADDLRTRTYTWSKELRQAGVTMNLAPVADLVDVANPDTNSPIGHWKREFGHDATTVTRAVRAACEGAASAGLIPTLKHFPGLGRVADNTDTTAGVTDTSTVAGDSSLSVFDALIKAAVPAIMVSSAVYSQLDPTQPAVFSAPIITDLLRSTMGFEGVVITDDVSAAVQVKAVPPAERAVRAIAAGVDIVLISADSSVAPPMATALVQRASSDPAFAAQVDAAVRRVLWLKSLLGKTLAV